MDCIICGYAIDNIERLIVILPCHHNSICSFCYLRLRVLQQNLHCVICKSKHDQIIATHIDSMKKNYLWSDFTFWGDDIGPDYRFDYKAKMFFPKDYIRNVIQPLLSWNCHLCSDNFNDGKSLNSHLRMKHNMVICVLCIDNKRSFPSEQKRYLHDEYDIHLKFGDADGSIGHPTCEFCRVRYYDREMLIYHLRKDHQYCHICEKEGVVHQYYNNYQFLNSHFKRDHFICEEPECLAKGFVVFSHQVELSSHCLTCHPSMASRVVPITFKVRRNDSSENLETQDNRSKKTGLDANKRRLEGGVGGIVKNGQWKLELPANLDPRAATREGNEIVPITSVSSTMNLEEYPSLPSAPTTTSTAGGNSNSSIPAFKVAKVNIKKPKANLSKKHITSDDFPTLSNDSKSNKLKHYNESVYESSYSQISSKPQITHISIGPDIEISQSDDVIKQQNQKKPTEDDFPQWETSSQSNKISIHSTTSTPINNTSSASWMNLISDMSKSKQQKRKQKQKLSVVNTKSNLMSKVNTTNTVGWCAKEDPSDIPLPPPPSHSSSNSKQSNQSQDSQIQKKVSNENNVGWTSIGGSAKPAYVFKQSISESSIDDYPKLTLSQESKISQITIPKANLSLVGVTGQVNVKVKKIHTSSISSQLKSISLSANVKIPSNKPSLIKVINTVGTTKKS